MKNLIYKLPNGGRVKIATVVSACLEIFIQKSIGDLEAGGLLLGRRIIDSDDIVIDMITTPTKFDVRKRGYFFRDSKIHQKTVELEFNKSSGTCNLLGEWHTHPEGYPKPSNYDLSEWKRQLEVTKLEEENLFFLIAGISEISIWEGNKKTGKIVKLGRGNYKHDY